MRITLLGSLAVVIMAAFLPCHQAIASTRIFWDFYGINMLAARTMDLNQDDKPALYVMPAGLKKAGGTDANPAVWTATYGSVVIRHRALNNLCGEGMNTEGLAFHYLYMAGSQYETRDGRPGVDGGVINFPR